MATEHDSSHLAKELVSVVSSSFISKEKWHIYHGWIKRLPEFDPASFWSASSAVGGWRARSGGRNNGDVCPVRVTLMESTLIKDSVEILSTMMSDLEGVKSPDGEPLFDSLLQDDGTGVTMLEWWWRKISGESKSVNAGSLDYMSKECIETLRILMDHTPVSAWTFMDNRKDGPGQGWIRDIREAIKKMPRYKEEDIKHGIEVIERIQSHFPSPAPKSEDSLWWTFDITKSGHLDLAHNFIQQGGGRFDDLLEVGDLKVPAWEWYVWRYLSKGEALSKGFMDLIRDLPDNTPINGADRERLLKRETLLPCILGGRELSEKDEAAIAEDENLEGRPLLRFRKKLWQQTRGADFSSEELGSEKEQEQWNAHFKALQENPGPLVNSMTDKEVVMEILHCIASDSQAVLAASPHDKRGNVGVIRKMANNAFVDVLGRTPFYGFTTYRLDLMGDILKTLEERCGGRTEEMKENLRQQIRTKDPAGHGFFGKLALSGRSEEVFEKSRTVARKLGVEDAMTFGFEKEGLCQHSVKWSRYLDMRHRSWDKKGKWLFLQISPFLVWREDPESVFGDKEAQADLAACCYQTMDAWADDLADALKVDPDCLSPTANERWKIEDNMIPDKIKALTVIFLEWRRKVIGHGQSGPGRYDRFGFGGYRGDDREHEDVEVESERLLIPELRNALAMMLPVMAGNASTLTSIKKTLFGRPDSTTYKNGFFADTFPVWAPSQWTPSGAFLSRHLKDQLLWPGGAIYCAKSVIENVPKQRRGYMAKIDAPTLEQLRHKWGILAEKGMLAQVRDKAEEACSASAADGNRKPHRAPKM